MKSKLKMGIAGLSPEKLAAKATILVKKMNGNTHFPAPMPDLSDVTDARDELLGWMEKAQFGDRLAIATRKTKEKILADLMRSLAHYVAFIAQGDRDVILSSGFEIRRRSTASLPIGIPVALAAERSPRTGVVELVWKPSHGNVSYLIEMATQNSATQNPATPEVTYEFTGITHKRRFTVEGLTPGTYYRFRVKAVGRKAESGYSDPALVMAA